MAARWPVGGIRAFLQYLYSQPAFADHQIDLLAPGKDLAPALASWIPRDSFNVVQSGTGAKNLFKMLRASLGGGSYDLLHTHGLGTAILGQLARMGQGVPHLASIHDVFLPATFSGPVGSVKQIGLNLALRGISAVHTVSEDCGENFHEYVPLVPKGRIHPILNGIDTNRFARAEQVDRRLELDLPAEVKLIGFFGRFMAPKGFRTLIAAVDELRHAERIPPFRVLTFGWGGFIREDFAYLRQKGLGDMFIQLPHTDRPESWMKAMDVIAMPSKWEACGLVAMEALSAGVPIVGTSCIGLREVLTGSPAAMVPPGDHAALAEQLARHITLSRRSEFLSYQTEAMSRFSISHQAVKMLDLYRDLVAE